MGIQSTLVFATPLTLATGGCTRTLPPKWLMVLMTVRLLDPGALRA